MFELFKMKTQIVFGENALFDGLDFIKNMGRKAAIVTGKTSAKISGALEDVIKVLDKLNIEYVVIDIIENNPGLENVAKAAQIAKEAEVDFVVGIGGGSPLDATKAVSVLATNDISPIRLYENEYENPPLKIVAIPTTAGTGSEVTPYSILTLKEKNTKKSFKNIKLFPEYAFIDYRYTKTLNREITMNTAIDAFTHALEGYMSVKRTRISDVLAIESMKLFFSNSLNLIEFNMNDKVRQDLIYSSTLAGMVISQTGTTCMHAMGYSLTYFLDVPHGLANGMLLEAYLKMLYNENKENKDRIDEIVKKTDLVSFEDMLYKINRLVGKKSKVSKEQIDKFAKTAMIQSSINSTSADMDYNRVRKLYEDALND